MNNRALQHILSASVLVIALALAVVGTGRSHTVSKNPALEPPPSLPEFTPEGMIKAPGMTAPDEATKAVSDRELIENATFTGVTRIDDVLYFTYDPSQPRGKQSCPT